MGIDLGDWAPSSELQCYGPALFLCHFVSVTRGLRLPDLYSSKQQGESVYIIVIFFYPIVQR